MHQHTMHLHAHIPLSLVTREGLVDTLMYHCCPCGAEAVTTGELRAGTRWTFEQLEAQHAREHQGTGTVLAEVRRNEAAGRRVR